MRKLLKILFSRYAISAFLLLLELGLICVFLFELSYYSVYFLIAVIAINALSLVAVINEEGNPEYKLTWMAVVLLVPLFGTVLFLMFKRRRMSRREVRRLRLIGEELLEYPESHDAFSDLGEENSLAAGKAMAIVDMDGCAEVYRGTVSSYFRLGEDMYESMLKDLSEAKSFIFLEYFIIDKGEMWDGIYGILRSKVKEGVEVRVMYDDIGCMSTLPYRFDRMLAEQGIKCQKFSRVSADIRNMHSNNNRDHRKICIIDGRVGYTGGINIADEYINRRERFGHWKDTGIRLEGEAVRGLCRLFLSLWELTSGEREKYGGFLNTGAGQNSDGGYYIPFGSGPRPMYAHQVGKRTFLDIINQAEQYVYITTPYLIIDFDLSEALRGAALRGVDVRIITPAKADKPMVKVMTKSSYPHLMESGVKIYEYTPGFIHSKTLACDDRYAVIGTINLDYRSLVHHFEDGVWMYMSPTVIDIRRDFLSTMAQSHRMTKDEARLNLFEWAVRCGIRLFAPLL